MVLGAGFFIHLSYAMIWRTSRYFEIVSALAVVSIKSHDMLLHTQIVVLGSTCLWPGSSHLPVLSRHLSWLRNHYWPDYRLSFPPSCNCCPINACTTDQNVKFAEDFELMLVKKIILVIALGPAFFHMDSIITLLCMRYLSLLRSLLDWPYSLFTDWHLVKLLQITL